VLDRWENCDAVTQLRNAFDCKRTYRSLERRKEVMRTNWGTPIGVARLMEHLLFQPKPSNHYEEEEIESDGAEDEDDD